MKQRVAYLDIAKGILILMVIFIHVTAFYNNCVGYNEVMTRISFSIKPFFESYLMPGFFFISGYCSRFSIEPKLFLTKQFQTIILPTILLHIVVLIIFGGHIHFIDFPYYVLDMWFIVALLISRILYYFIARIPVLALRYLLPLVFFVLGVWMKGNVEDPYLVQQGFIALFFVALGNMLQGKEITNRMFLSLSVIYPLSILLLQFFGVNIPIMGRGINFGLWQIPLFLLLSLSGTGMVLGISKRIAHNRILEYFGQNSLSGYLLHGSFLVFLYKCIVHFDMVPVSVISSVLVLFGSFAAASLWCYILAKILNTKHFKFILGKF